MAKENGKRYSAKFKFQLVLEVLQRGWRAVLPGTGMWVAGSNSLPTAGLPCGTQTSTRVEL